MRKSIILVNPKIEVMVETRICSHGISEENGGNIKDFWNMMNEWETQNIFTFWMHEAFDNPFKEWAWGPTQGFCGWWRLRNNNEVNSVSGYLEKIMEFKEIPNSTSFHNAKNNLTVRPPSNFNASRTNAWVYGGSIFGPVIALISLVLLIAQWFRTNKFWNILTREEIKQFLNGVSNAESENIITPDDIVNSLTEMEAINKPFDISVEMPKASFQVEWNRPLGSGEFGCVYKAMLQIGLNQGSVAVALKMAKDKCVKTALMSILREIKILLYLGQHNNIVSIQGAYTTEIARGVVYLALELCELGSLKNFLRNRERNENLNDRYYKNIELSIKNNELVQWSYACGMEYLKEKHVIHADLATRNVLLTAEKTAKITDFGLSRRLYEYSQYIKKQQEPLPWRWMAIESLKNSEFSSQSDVWSYGVTLWETFLDGAFPYPGLSWTTDFVDSLETGLRMKSPAKTSPEIFTIMSICWDKEPQARPTFSELNQSYAKIIENFEILML